MYLPQKYTICVRIHADICTILEATPCLMLLPTTKADVVC